MKNRKIILALLFVVSSLTFFACGSGGGDEGNNNVSPVNTNPQNSTKTITAFSLNGVIGTINETAKTIAVIMPNGTNITALVATFTTTGASVKVGTTVQASGITTNDFTSSVRYTVIAIDGSAVNYTVTVTVAPDSTKAITAFSLDGVIGTINETTKTITISMPNGTNVTALVATFTTTGISVQVGTTNQVSGTTANNFTNLVNYIVTAEDGTTANYMVNVDTNTSKAITAFSLNGVVSTTIEETSKIILVNMPNGTNVTALIATFITTGTSVKVGTTDQKSGQTANDFTNSVFYTVTAVNGTTVNYEVKVIVAELPITIKTPKAYIFYGNTELNFIRVDFLINDLISEGYRYKSSSLTIDWVIDETNWNTGGNRGPHIFTRNSFLWQDIKPQAKTDPKITCFASCKDDAECYAYAVSVEEFCKFTPTISITYTNSDTKIVNLPTAYILPQK